MSINYEQLAKAPRLLLEAELKPLQGNRFQPTGFADMGAARYTLPDGTEMLLVESAQSVANRMEMACWDEIKGDLIQELMGLPYIIVANSKGKAFTNSILEAHRINSEYVMKAGGEPSNFSQTFKSEIDYAGDSPVNWKKFQSALFKYDPNSLIHGTFLEEIGGRLRITRSLSGFIEARNVRVAESGGVKNNIVQPDLKDGEGNVPYPRTEFVAESIAAYFNLDIAMLRGYSLGVEAQRLLIALALFKVRRFLSTGMRLRTACDFEVKGDLKISRPEGFKIPDEQTLLKECVDQISACAKAGLFANPPITTVEWKPSKKGKDKKGAETGESGEDE